MPVSFQKSEKCSQHKSIFSGFVDNVMSQGHLRYVGSKERIRCLAFDPLDPYHVSGC